jgi:hypothetical protein
MKSKDEINLVKSKDGTYVPEGTNCKEKQNNNNNAEEFIKGLDSGLDFISNVSKRIKRLKNL